MPRRENNIKQRVSESRAKRVWTLSSVSCFDQRSNIVKREQKSAQIFGSSKDLITLSLSLSQILTCNTLTDKSSLTGALIYGFSWTNPREAALFFSVSI